MGVTGLWSVVAPTARPTKLETLNRKRLAVDASIWIYQFLKAVRDKEGNALRNSHVVGFFRRICKLLYFGILPVFVFDGGAPGLKRETIQKRRRRREGRREDATRTAGKLLAVQVARAAEEEDRRRKQARHRPEEEMIHEGDELVYVDEIGLSKEERVKERAERFKKKDQYHLPDLDVSLEAMGAPNDPRIMSQAELEEYARHFHSGEDINLYDFSKIDFESPFFISLPAGDRYNILNAARLRSRLRMGYSKEQLDGMFPDRMAFSRFQIERVKERNELTQRLMHINGMSEEWDQGGRIAGEKGKEYILVKNEGVEGGWALGVVSNKQGTKKEDAIDVDDEERSIDEERNEEDDEDFEDVAIEGLNRLPKSMRKPKKDLRELDYDISYEQAAETIAKKRQAVYEARRKATSSKPLLESTTTLSQQTQKPHTRDLSRGDDLFVAQDNEGEEADLFEDVPTDVPHEDEELRRAIAMSLELDETPAGGFIPAKPAETGWGLSSDDEELDLSAALAESRRSKYTSMTNIAEKLPSSKMPEHNFSGPLPFESLNLGQSLLGKKKADKIEQDMSGGFDRDAGQDAFRKPKQAQPLPSWFNASSGATFHQQMEDDHQDDHITYGREDVDRRETLRRHPTKEVVDLEAEDIDEDDREPELYSEVNYDNRDSASLTGEPQERIAPRESSQEIQEPDFDEATDLAHKEKAAREREERYKIAQDIAAGYESEVEDIDKKSEKQVESIDRVVEYAQANSPLPENGPTSASNFQSATPSLAQESGSDEEKIDWSESDQEGPPQLEEKQPAINTSASVEIDSLFDKHDSEGEEEEDDDEVFEDIEMDEPQQVSSPSSHAPKIACTDDERFLVEDHLNNDVETTSQPHEQENGYDGYLSESEEELMRQLAIEAEGHAEFASSLNHMKTSAQAARDYENELKQLRNQQKKDRRDADEVTQAMIQECQALLGLFGLPYITAPMEAEAQCAELVHLGLVDGIVTDDSDIFLFGGTRIYKNMFNAAKFVECYVTQDLEKEYDLDRKKLIRFAHLLGSDYTEGIPGIGPVTALEIISDFTDLEEFKEWCSKVQLGRPQDLENQLTTQFRRKFKKTVQKKLFLPPVFPDLRVDYAYLNPEVDSTPEDFQWGVPDLDKLRGFLMATIGWNQDRTDEILVPVIRDMNKREQEGTQANITRFFTGGAGVGAAPVEGAAPRNRTGKESGRMKNAYARLRGEAKKRRLHVGDEDLANAEDATIEGDDEMDGVMGTPKRKPTSESTSVAEDDESSDVGSKPRRSNKVKKRKTKS